MSFDVIITTCNRSQRVSSLLKQIVDCSTSPNRVIVVDSSDNADDSLATNTEILYQHTVRKNQPYQRYVGYSLSISEIVVFFDDDIEILDVDIFAKFLAPYSYDSNIVGVTVGIDYRSVINEAVASGDLRHAVGIKRRLLNAIWTITGAPPLKFGDIFLAGLAGGIPAGFEGYVKYFQGANMSFRRKIMAELFDETVFDLYDRRIGKGEDKMLSIRANRFGRLYSTGGLCLWHPAVESHYFQDIAQFHRRSMFSRLYLSKVYCETFLFPWILGILHYYWFCFWRIFVSSVKVMAGDKKSALTLKGQLSGVKLATTFLLETIHIRKNAKRSQ